MVEALFLTTGIIVVLCTAVNYQRTRDPLCVMVVFAPMLIYFYAYHPLVMVRNPDVATLIGPPAMFTRTAIVNLLGVSEFCIGCCIAGRSRIGGRDMFADVGRNFSHRGRRQVYMIAMLFGAVSVGVFSYLVWRSGGFARVFMSGDKPYLSGGGSGYIGELPMLTYPAMLLLAVSRQGLRVRFIDACAYFFCASPQLTWAVFGGQQPMFLLIMTLAASWVIVRSRRPKLATVLAGLMSVGLLVVFLAATRHSLFLGSEQEFSFSQFTEDLTAGTETVYGDEFICGYAVIEVSDHFNRYYWGQRFIVQLFVRPIPRQLWPTKYEDTGLAWMEGLAGTSGFEQSEWLQATGFATTVGSSTGFVADLYLEFWWGVVPTSFLLGWYYSYLWNKSHREGGFWTVFYYIALILSIYLVAQSVVSAWGYRMLLLGLPTYLIWSRIVAPRSKYRYRERPASMVHSSNTGIPAADGPESG